MSIWNWITGNASVLEEVRPLVVNGEAILADLKEIIADLKNKRFDEVVDGTKKAAADLATFSAEVEKIVNLLKTPADPAR
jgi:hypothetical protein